MGWDGAGGDGVECGRVGMSKVGWGGGGGVGRKLDSSGISTAGESQFLRQRYSTANGD